MGPGRFRSNAGTVLPPARREFLRVFGLGLAAGMS
jgi:hypothetical protein